MKIFSRLVILNFLIGYIIAFYSPLSFHEYKTIGQMESGDFMLFVWVGLSIVCGFLWLGYIFYHWGVNDFKNRKTKRRWFWVISIGTLFYLVGPIIYHIVVIEMAKGLQKKTK